MKNNTSFTKSICGLITLFFLFICLCNPCFSNENTKTKCEGINEGLKKGKDMMDKDNYSLSNSIFTKSITTFKRNNCNDSSILGHLYLGKANLMLLTFLSDSATHYLNLALKIAEETNDEKFKSRINTSIGIMMNQSGQYEKALIHYKKAAATLTKLEVNEENIRRKAISSYNLGLTYSNLKKTDEAIIHLQEAILFGKEINFTPIIIDAHGVLAKELRSAKDTLWTHHLDTAINLSVSIKNNLKIAQGMLFWANHYFENNRHLETKKYAENALLHISDSSMNFLKPRIFELLAESNFKLMQFEESANYHKLSKYYKSYYDSINNEEITYKFEEKLKFEKEISQEKFNVLTLEKKIQTLNYLIISSILLLLLTISYYQYKAKSKIWLNAIFHLSLKSKKSSNTKDFDPILDIWIRAADLLANEKIFLEKTLSAEDVTKILGTNLNYLSKAIKTYSNLNFKTYLNKLRFEHAKNLILEKKAGEKIDFNEISENSGFNSIQTFYRIFKSFSGLSPSKWVEKNT